MLTNYGRLNYLKLINGLLPPFVIDYGLYTNSGVVWSVNTALTDLTEGTWTGYGRASPMWGSPFINGSGNGESDGTWLTFNNTGGTDVVAYGYFLIGSYFGSDIFDGNNFSSPLTILAHVGSLQLQPVLQDDTF